MTDELKAKSDNYADNVMSLGKALKRIRELEEQRDKLFAYIASERKHRCGICGAIADYSDVKKPSVNFDMSGRTKGKRL